MGSLYRRKPKGPWQAKYKGADGKLVRKSTGTSSKDDAAKILRKWEDDANLVRQGIKSNSPTDLQQLLAEYLDYLSNSGDKHLQATESRLQLILAATGWSQATHINQLQLETMVRTVRYKRGTKGQERSLGLRTQGHYIAAMKSWTTWMVDLRNAIARDPLSGIKKPNFNADRKLVRRYLLKTEWPWLAKTANAVLYETAIQTGFRVSELAALSPCNLGHDHVQLSAGHTKNKQDAKQYITKGLRARLEGQLPFELPDLNRLAAMLREDLAIARQLAIDANAEGAKQLDFLAPVNAMGHVLDFHALRHTCGAWLAETGVNPKVIQTVMRHSTITLTLDTYGHLMPGAERDAVKVFECM